MKLNTGTTKKCTDFSWRNYTREQLALEASSPGKENLKRLENTKLERDIYFHETYNFPGVLVVVRLLKQLLCPHIHRAKQTSAEHIFLHTLQMWSLERTGKMEQSRKWTNSSSREQSRNYPKDILYLPTFTQQDAIITVGK